MGCFVAILALISPRLVLVLVWLFNHNRFTVAFHNSFLLPLLGFIFLPWTTLIYAFAYNPILGHLSTWGWIWVILALFVDLGSYGAANWGRSSRGGGGAAVVESE